MHAPSLPTAACVGTNTEDHRPASHSVAAAAQVMWWPGVSNSCAGHDAPPLSFTELFRETDGPHKTGRTRCRGVQCGVDTAGVKGILLEPADPGPEPCVVVYCPGGHAGDVYGEDVLGLAEQLCDRQISLLCLDVASGKRGACDAEDVRLAVGHVRDFRNPTYQKLALWGRGAGASAALRYAAVDPELAAVICDDAEAPVHEAWILDLGQHLARHASDSLFGACAIGDPLAGGGLRRLGSIVGGGRSGGDASLFEIVARCQIPALFMYSLDNQRVALRLRQECARHGGQAEVHQVSGTPSESRQPTDVARALVLLLRAFGNPADIAQPCVHPEKLALPAHIRELLNDGQHQCRRLGFLKAALHVRPLEGAKIERILFAAQPGSFTAPTPSLNVHGTIKLPDETSEAALAWAVETGNRGGSVYFAFVSPHLVSLTVVHLEVPSKDADGMAHSIVDLGVFGTGPGTRKADIHLRVSGTAGVDFKVGEDCLQVSHDVAWSQACGDTGAGCVGPAPTLWTAVSPNAPSSKRPRIDLWSTMDGCPYQLRGTPVPMTRGIARGSSGGESAAPLAACGADAASLTPTHGKTGTLLTCTSLVSRTDGSLTMSAWSSQAPSPTSACTPVTGKGRLPSFGTDAFANLLANPEPSVLSSSARPATGGAKSVWWAPSTKPASLPELEVPVPIESLVPVPIPSRRLCTIPRPVLTDPAPPGWELQHGPDGGVHDILDAGQSLQALEPEALYAYGPADPGAYAEEALQRTASPTTRRSMLGGLCFEHLELCSHWPTAARSYSWPQYEQGGEVSPGTMPRASTWSFHGQLG